MIKSMTAFSRQDQTISNTTISWEVRSVNHRHLDISLHLPDAFIAQENSLKEIIRSRLGRGKLDAKLLVEYDDLEANSKIALNEDKVKALLSARKKLEALSKIPLSLSVMDILQWPDIIDKNQALVSSNYFKDVSEQLEITLNDLIEARELEGARLYILIETRCKAVSNIVKEVRLRRVAVQVKLREKVLKKLAEIDVTADPNRLEQELVYQAQRLDVDEELDRLDSHIEEVLAVLKRDEPIGRRLDFLMQELNREANTLASKSNDSETTKSAVELKVLIEQMREQCLNIE